MYYCLCEYYQGFSNYDFGLTLTHFTPRSNLVTQAFVWEKVKISILFLETITALGLKLLEKNSTKLVDAVEVVSKVTQISKLKLVVSGNS